MIAETRPRLKRPEKIEKRPGATRRLELETNKMTKEDSRACTGAE